MKKFPVLLRVVLGSVISATVILGSYAGAAITTCCWPDGTCADIDSATCTANSGTSGGSYARCATSACPTAVHPIRIQATSFTPPQSMTIQWESHVGVKYTVLWGTDLNSINTPLGTKTGPDNAITDTTATDPKRFYRVRYETPAPTPEACCFLDGSCMDLNAGSCVNQSGTPQGPGTTCSTTSCPQPPQACCFPDNSCTDMPASFCSLNGGTPQGPGTYCASGICLSGGVQACCFPDYSCTNMPASICTQSGGTPQGLGINCSSVFCIPFSEAACCFSDGTCVDGDAGQCYVYGGTPQGPGTNCFNTFCGSSGTPDACCFQGGFCVALPPNECWNNGGMPQGSGTSCSFTFCPPF